MDFIDQISQLSDRVEKMKEKLLTEEATKNALIMPFIQVLGYDVFNPSEVIPEYTSDVGTKKGEKVDYAIMHENKMIMLIECKGINDKLTKHDSQLMRYFHTSEAKFAILTNGQFFKFYSDIDQSNKMDEKPFFEIDLLNIKEQQVSELKKFHKTNFDINQIIGTASELKYSNEIKTFFDKEFQEPSETFVKFIIHNVFQGKATSKIIEKFTGITKNALTQWLRDKVSNRLKTALDKESQANKEEAQKIENDIKDPKRDIETTEEEMEGFLIIKAIIRQKIDVSRVFYRDAKTYFTINIDDNNRKLVCRLHFNNSSNKYIEVFDVEKNSIKHSINNIDDIYNYSKELLDTVSLFN